MVFHCQAYMLIALGCYLNPIHMKPDATHTHTDSQTMVLHRYPKAFTAWLCIGRLDLSPQQSILSQHFAAGKVEIMWCESVCCHAKDLVGISRC